MRMTTCGSCASAVDHCHGTLVIHAGLVAECTDPDCVDNDHSRHTFVIDCGDIAGGCYCTLTSTSPGPLSGRGERGERGS